MNKIPDFPCSCSFTRAWAWRNSIARGCISLSFGQHTVANNRISPRPPFLQCFTQHDRSDNLRSDPIFQKYISTENAYQKITALDVHVHLKMRRSVSSLTIPIPPDPRGPIARLLALLSSTFTRESPRRTGPGGQAFGGSGSEPQAIVRTAGQKRPSKASDRASAKIRYIFCNRVRR